MESLSIQISLLRLSKPALHYREAFSRTSDRAPDGHGDFGHIGRRHLSHHVTVMINSMM
jgi:hypothetical protein